MRNKTFISSMVGVAAAAAVAGSANAAIVKVENLNYGITANYTLEILSNGTTGTLLGAVRFIRSSTLGGTFAINQFNMPGYDDPSIPFASTFVSNGTTTFGGTASAQGGQGQASNLGAGFVIGNTMSGSNFWAQTNSSASPNTEWSGTASSRTLNRGTLTPGSFNDGNFNNTTGFIGFEILTVNPSTFALSNKLYGFIQYTGSGGTGTIVGWAFEDSGASITTFAVPAPGALALLGVAGLVGARRRRA